MGIQDRWQRRTYQKIGDNSVAKPQCVFILCLKEGQEFGECAKFSR